MKYVVKNVRLREYLFNLGFDYEQVQDKTGKQDYVYLFEANEYLYDAMSFFTELRKRTGFVANSTSKQ